MVTTPEELARSREQFAKMVSEIQQSVKAAGDQAGANASQIEQLTKALTEIRQQQSALNLAVARASEGEYGESEQYVHVEPEHVKSFSGSFLKNDAGVVQLVAVKSHDAGEYFGLLDDPNPRDAAQRTLQAAVQRRGLVRRMLAQANGVEERQVSTPRLDREVRRAIRAMPERVAKIFAPSAGVGLEWLPTRTSPELEREVRAISNLASMFPTQEHPGGTLQLPYISGQLQAFAEAVPATDGAIATATASSVGTGQATVSVSTSTVHAYVHREATEDAIIAVLPQIYADIADALAFADDNCLINGHTSGTQDALASWNPRGRMATMGAGATSQLRRFDGFRRLALAGGASSSANISATQTLAGFMTIVRLLGIEQLVDNRGRSRIVILVNPEFFFSTMLGWSEFSSYQQLGALAALITGNLGLTGAGLPNQVGTLYGQFPVCLAYPITKDLNASGVFDNVTTTKTGMLAVDRMVVEQWMRPGATVESAVEIRNNTISVVGRKRNTFRVKRLGTGQYAAAYGYNLTP